MLSITDEGDGGKRKSRGRGSDRHRHRPLDLGTQSRQASLSPDRRSRDSIPVQLFFQSAAHRFPFPEVARSCLHLPAQLCTTKQVPLIHNFAPQVQIRTVNTWTLNINIHTLHKLISNSAATVAPLSLCRKILGCSVSSAPERYDDNESFTSCRKEN